MHKYITSFISYMIFLLAFSNHSSAATIIVNDDQDNMVLDGNCDLRDAILSANVNFSVDGCTAGQAGIQDLIIVQVAGPIQLESTLPVFSSMIITTSFNTDPVEIIAPPNNRVMRVEPISENDNDFSMINFKLTGGQAPGNEFGGGAIYFNGEDDNLGDIGLSGMIFENNHGVIGGALHFDNTFADSLLINDNIFVDNTSDDLAGAIAALRVVKSGAARTMKIHRSHFEGNSTDGTAGAVFIQIEEVGSVIIEDNQFINNSAIDGTGALGVGAWVDTQTFDLNRNIFMFNQAGTDSGAVQVGFSSITYIRDSLFAFNSAQRGGAVTAVFNDSLLRLSNSTLVHNSASISGDNIHIYSTGRMIPNNNIIAYPVNGDNCFGSLGVTTNQGITNNMIDDNSCEMLNNAPLTSIIDPLLTGFSTEPDLYPGFAPTTRSPALDRTSSCGDKDVMRRDRPSDGDGDGQAFCDIGAIESPASNDFIWTDSFGL